MAFLTQVDTETLSNQNIATALLVSTFTNTTRIRKLYVNIFLDQIAGNGVYYAYLTVQRAGAGSAYVLARTAFNPLSGDTAIAFASMAVSLNATDVLKAYVIGLAGDTTTPDVIVDVNEETPLSAAEVNAEVVDALATDTYAEPTGVPAATATLAAKINRMYQALRNGVDVTATKKKFKDDAEAALWEKDVSDNGTTYTETKGNAP